jgi:hypothetical protein
MWKKWTVSVLSMIIGVCLLPMNGFAVDVQCSVLPFTAELHGYFESRFIERDTTGFQYGLKEWEPVQWMQELQLDLTVRPTYPAGELPTFRFEKAFFRYRLDYDALWDITGRFNNIRPKSPADYEFGKDDLILNSDMRESYLDFVGETPGVPWRANMRLGKQIVQWGEADGFNVMNIINPSDYRSRMFFSNPEDLAYPLWMARWDFKAPGCGLIDSFNLQFLVIPDNTPDLYAPLDGNYVAPYAVFFKGFAPLPVHENAPSDNWRDMAYGVRFGWNILGWNDYLYYYSGHQENGAQAIDFSTAKLGYYTFDHPYIEAYGYSFNKFVDYGNFIFRGEGSYTTNWTETDFEHFGTSVNPKGYTYHDLYQVLFAVDKTISDCVPGTRSALSNSLQVWWEGIADYESNFNYSRNAPANDYRIVYSTYTDFIHGTLTPVFELIYDTADAWLVFASLNWCPDGHWYVELDTVGFFGDKKGMSAFAGYINTASEVEFRLGWKF